jgi:WD40 repeat protein
VTSIAPPSPEHPFIVSGDARGAIRVWPVQPRVARTVVTSSSRFQTALFSERSNRVVATTWQPQLTVFSPATGARSVAPHDAYDIFLEQSSTGATFAAYGPSDSVEIWSEATLSRSRVIATGHGTVSQLSYVSGTEDFVTSGNDGRLLRWTAQGPPTPIAKVDKALEHFVLMQPDGDIVFSAAGGEVWYVHQNESPTLLRASASAITVLFSPPGHDVVYAGYANGDVVSLDPRARHQSVVLHAEGAVREIASTPDGRRLAIATNDGVVSIGDLPDGRSGTVWSPQFALAVRANDIALTSDGLLLAVCADGMIWLYQPERQRWLCLPIGTADVGFAAVSSTGDTAVAIDSEGRLTWIDLELARKLLE